MTTLSPEQKELIGKTREAANRAAAYAIRAELAGLRVLASFWRDVGLLLKEAVNQQERAFRDDALQQPLETNDALADAIIRWVKTK